MVDIEILKELLEEKKLKLREVGEILNLSPSYVSKLAKKHGISTNPPGHPKDTPLSEEHKENIRESIVNKE